jgi:hypothetical protein
MEKIKLLDLDNNKQVDVDEAELPRAISSGKFAVQSDKDFEFEDKEGERRIVPGSQVFDAFDAGFKFIPKSQAEREARLEEAGDSPVLASAVGTLRGLTAGISDQIITRTGAMSQQELNDLNEANPALSTGFEIGGTVLPALLSGGTSLGARVLAKTPAALAGLAGAKVASKVGGKILAGTTSDVVKSAVKLGTGSAVEGALYGTGKLISEDALGNVEFNAENALATMGRSALEGAAFGGLIGAVGTPLAKATDKALAAANKKVAEIAESGGGGILKWAGADKTEFKKILRKASLDEKQLSDYALDITNGFSDNAESIATTGMINKPGGKGLLKTITTSIEDMADNNETVRQGAALMMDDSLSKLSEGFDAKIGKVADGDLVYGADLAQRVEEGVLNKIKDLSTPRKAAIQAIVDDLREVGVTRDAAGGIIKRSAMTPEQLKRQSIEFGELAKFDAQNPTGSQEVYRDLRQFTEDKIVKLMDSIDGGTGLSKKYKDGKKLYEKSKTMEDILSKGMAREFANNRGMSITEGLAGVAGGAIGGLPGAVGGYLLRKGQREYGDITVSYLLKKIEESSNKGKVQISNAVDGFLNMGEKAGRVTNKAILKSITGGDIKDEDNVEAKIGEYSQDPMLIVDRFMENNQDMLNAAPKTAQALQNRVIKAAEFLHSKIPKKDNSPFNDTTISRVDKQKFKNYVEAVEKPYKVLESLKQGYITPESMEAFKIVYPSMFSAIKQEFAGRLNDFKKITEKQKAELSRILGLDAKKAYTPAGFAQLQALSGQKIANEMENQNKVSVTAAKNINQSNRNQTGFDRVLSRN